MTSRAITVERLVKVNPCGPAVDGITFSGRPFPRRAAAPVQAVAGALPPTYVFEGMRSLAAAVEGVS